MANKRPKVQCGGICHTQDWIASQRSVGKNVSGSGLVSLNSAQLSVQNNWSLATHKSTNKPEINVTFSYTNERLISLAIIMATFTKSFTVSCFLIFFSIVNVADE